MPDLPTTPGTRELVLTDEQAAVLGDWLAETDRFVVIGSIHPRPYRPGLQGREIGQIVAVVGTVPRERLGAVRLAATGRLKVGRAVRKAKTTAFPAGEEAATGAA